MASIEATSPVNYFRKIESSLSTTEGCLLYGSRIIIPPSLQPQVLELLHLGHFGMVRMKQLARTAVYWPGIDAQIEDTCRQCTACGEHQHAPEKLPNHPWMVPEKPWSRIHVDHAIDFLGSHWLVIIDAFSKYPCIYPTTSTSTASTTALLEETFAHFGYPHSVVSDNATTFTSGEFQEWCQQRGISHLSGAPYHPATNGAAERLVGSFKQSLKKSSLPPKLALQEFLRQYRRTPLPTGYSPSELLNGRQIRAKVDAILPSPAHLAQRRQVRQEAARVSPVKRVQDGHTMLCSLLRTTERETTKMGSCHSRQSYRATNCDSQSAPQRSKMEAAPGAVATKTCLTGRFGAT